MRRRRQSSALSAFTSAWLVAVLLLFGGSSASAAPATGSISGTATASGAPVAHGIVTVYAGPTGAWVGDAEVGESGAFSVGGLRTGSYAVQVTPYGDSPGTGYQPTYHPAALTRAQATLVSVTDGSTTTGVDVALLTGGAVTGTVSEPRGDGIGNIDVVGVDPTTGAQFSALTQADGGYRAEGVRPGSYDVRFSDYDGGHIAEYWDNAPTEAAATPVVVTAGVTHDAVDATLTNGGSISGLVTASDGNPVSGVTARATPASGGIPLTAVTDAQGRYTIESVPDGSYTVSFASAADSAFQTGRYDGSVSVAGGAALTGIDAVLAGGGRITGTVVDADGAPLANILVAAAGPTTGLGLGRYAFTGPDGKYEIRGIDPGTVRVLFFDEATVGSSAADSRIVSGYYPNSSTSADAELIPVRMRETTSGIDLRSVRPAVIAGKATDASGAAAANAPVTLWQPTGAGGFGAVAQRSTAADGSYRFSGLKAGEYIVAFAEGSSTWAARYWPAANRIGDAQRLTIAAGDKRTDIDVELARGATISGTLSAADGAQLSSTNIVLYDASGSGVRSTQADANGHYAFTGLQAGTYRTFFRANAGSVVRTRYYRDAKTLASATPVDVEAGATRSDIDQALPGPGRIRGTVFGPDGLPLVGAVVEAHSSSTGWVSLSATLSTTTDASGTYSLSGSAISDGAAYVLRFVAPPTDARGLAPVWQGGVTNATDAESQVIADGDDISGIDATLHVGAQLSGTVTSNAGGAISGALVYVFDYSDARISASATTDVNGRYSFKGLPAGSYSMSVSPPQGYVYKNLRDRIRLTGSETHTGVDVTLAAAGTIGGTVTGAGGAGVDATIMAVDEQHLGTDGWSPSAMYASVSSGAPTFRLPGLTPGRYRLLARADQYVDTFYTASGGTTRAADADAVDIAAGDSKTASFTVRAGGAITGVVRSSASGTVAYATIEALTASGGSLRSTSSGASGAYSLAGLRPGSYRLRVTAGGYDTRYSGSVATLSDATTLSVTEGVTLGGQDVTLAATSAPGTTPTTPGTTPTTPGTTPPTPGTTPTGGLRGRVAAPAGASLSGSWVYLLRSGGANVAASGIAHDGTFAFPDLVVGDCTLLVVPSDTSGLVATYLGDVAGPADATIVHLGSGGQQDVGTISVINGARITGRVTDAGGAPVSGVTVYAKPLQYTGWWASDDTDSAGNYDVIGVAPGDTVVAATDADGRYADSFKGGATEQTATHFPAVGGAAISGVDLTVARAGSIIGNALDSAGDLVVGPAGADGSGPTVLVENTATGFSKSLSVDGTGRYAAGNLPAGTYLVRFVPPGGYVAQTYPSGALDAGSAVTVTAGGVTSVIDARLAAGATVEGQVVNDQGAGVRATIDAFDSAGARVGTAATGPSGRYVIGIPSSAVRLRVRDPRATPAFAPLYYGGTSLATATPLTVATGMILDVDDITIAGAPTWTDAGGYDSFPLWRSTTGPRPVVPAPASTVDGPAPNGAPNQGKAAAPAVPGPLAAPVGEGTTAQPTGPLATFVSGARLHADRAGRFPVVVRCRVGSSCAGGLVVTAVAHHGDRARLVTVAKAGARVRWAGTKRFRMQLNGRGRSLARRGTMGVTLTMRPGGPGPLIQQRARLTVPPARYR